MYIPDRKYDDDRELRLRIQIQELTEALKRANESLNFNRDIITIYENWLKRQKGWL